MELEPFCFAHPAGALRLVARALPQDAPGSDGETAHPPADPVAEAVNRFALRPLAPHEYVVFELDLCHNQIDRHFSRFPDEELETVNRLTPGRPLMERHDLRGSLPRGRFFDSRLCREGDRLYVRPLVYVLRAEANRDFIFNIEGGVYRETSIGFSFQTPECSICGRDLRLCDHEPGRTYGGRLCHFIMRGVLEVIEGSVVPAGSQGTGFLAVRNGAAGLPDASWPAPRALEAARARVHEPIELTTRRGHALWADE